MARLTDFHRQHVGLFLRIFLGLFAFVFYDGKRVFPSCLGDPYGCPRQIVS
jgi:hypothetical protein